MTLLAKWNKALAISFHSSLKIYSKVSLVLYSLHYSRIHRYGDNPLHGQAPAHSLPFQNSLLGLSIIQTKISNLLRHRQCLHLLQKHPIAFSPKTRITKINRTRQQRRVSLELRHSLLHQPRINLTWVQLSPQFIIVFADHPKIVMCL